MNGDPWGSAPDLAGLPLVVTGGAGFVGSAFVRHAVDCGAQVTVVAREGSDHWRLAPVAGRYATTSVSLDNLATASVGTGRGEAVVVHFAAAGVNQAFDDVDVLVDTNVVGTLRVLQYAQRLDARRFVLVGTSGEYGPGVRIDEDAPLRPTSEYGATRASATLLARAFGARRGLDVVVVRPFAVYGPYEAPYRLVPYCILGGLRGEPLRISTGHQTRDYVFVDDVAAGIARACVAPAARDGTFNLCTGVETTVRQMAETIAELTGGGSTVEAGAREPIPGEMWRTSGDPARAAAQLGWAPRRSHAEGLRRTIRWFRAEGRALSVYAPER